VRVRGIERGLKGKKTKTHPREAMISLEMFSRSSRSWPGRSTKSCETLAGMALAGWVSLGNPRSGSVQERKPGQRAGMRARKRLRSEAMAS